ncbi:MAG: hypothetical protein EOP83_30950, partial [Verrucomicrobiaceae bacterium]
MSFENMHPKFGTIAEYREWRKNWTILHKDHTRRIRAKRKALRASQRAADNFPLGPRPLSEAMRKVQSELVIERAMGHKMMTLLKDAKLRAQRIYEMKKSIVEQNAAFPLTIEAPSFDFHFNKISLEFPFMPMWTVKTRGKTYYVDHLDFSQANGTTRETPDHPA